MVCSLPIACSICFWVRFVVSERFAFRRSGLRLKSFAPERLVLVSFAPERTTPARFTPVRSAPERFTLKRFAPERSGALIAGLRPRLTSGCPSRRSAHGCARVP